MSEQPKVFIAGIGMITPIGANTTMTAAAVRAGVSAYRNTIFYVGEDDRIRMALVPSEALQAGPDSDSENTPKGYSARQNRLLKMAAIALAEVHPLLPPGLKLPLFLAGPEQLIDGDLPVNINFLAHLAKKVGVNLNLDTSRVISMGRAGSLAAIQMAFRYFATSSETHVLVGGLDTYYDGRLLQLLAEDERLLAGGNKDGFIPGEGAAFLLLSRKRVPLFHSVNRAVCLYEPGLGHEPGYRGSKVPYRGDGLAEALTQALANAQVGTIKTLYSSINGENFFAKEHGVALIRNRERLLDSMKVEHPADCFGDLGSAFGPVVAGIAAVHLLGNSAVAPGVLCCSSDRDARAAMVMDVA